MCLSSGVSSEHILVGFYLGNIDEMCLFVRRIVEEIRRTDVEDDSAVVLNFVVVVVLEIPDVESLVP